MQVINNIHFERLSEQYFEQIAELQQYLWGGQLNYRKEMLVWKYLNNPFRYNLTGAVAVDGEKVVGFRGLVCYEWWDHEQLFKTISYTDAIVHPQYRGQNLLGRLNDFVEKEYFHQNNLIMVLYPNRVSGHIYKKQGILPFLEVNLYLRKFHWLKRSQQSADFEIIGIGEIEPDHFQDSSRPIHFHYSKEFLEWKLNEPSKNYIVLRSKNTKELSIILEQRTNKLELLYYPDHLFEAALNLIENYSSLYGVRLTNLPLTSTQYEQNKKILQSKGYRSYSFINRFRKGFFQKKEILMRPIEQNEFNLDLLSDPDKWNYKQIIYV